MERAYEELGLPYKDTQSQELWERIEPIALRKRKESRELMARAFEIIRDDAEFHTDELEAGALIATEDLAHERALDTVWFDNDERTFLFRMLHAG